MEQIVLSDLVYRQAKVVPSKIIVSAFLRRSTLSAEAVARGLAVIIRAAIRWYAAYHRGDSGIMHIRHW